MRVLLIAGLVLLFNSSSSYADDGLSQTATQGIIYRLTDQDKSEIIAHKIADEVTSGKAHQTPAADRALTERQKHLSSTARWIGRALGDLGWIAASLSCNRDDRVCGSSE